MHIPSTQSVWCALNRSKGFCKALIWRCSCEQTIVIMFKYSRENCSSNVEEEWSETLHSVKLCSFVSIHLKSLPLCIKQAGRIVSTLKKKKKNQYTGCRPMNRLVISLILRSLVTQTMQLLNIMIFLGCTNRSLFTKIEFLVAKHHTSKTTGRILPKHLSLPHCCTCWTAAVCGKQSKSVRDLLLLSSCT